MLLLVIQKDLIVRYQDHKQLEVYKVDWEELNKQGALLPMIESIRLGQIS